MSTPAPTPAPSVPMTGPVTIYNARINDLAPTVVTEQITDNIQFVYNPLTEAASFNFMSRQYVYVSGAPQQLAGTNMNMLQQDADAVIEECFGLGLADPVTGTDLSKVSVAGIMTIVKNAFDILYNRRAQIQAAANEAAGITNPSQAYPSQLAIMQANTLYDDYGNGSGGFPLGKAFGGLGTSDGAPSPSPLSTPPNPITPPAPAPTPSGD